MSSSNIPSLNTDHVVTGKINGSAGGSAVISDCNDGSVVITAATDGVQTITFGHPFSHIPTVCATVVDAAIATDASQGIVITSAATDAVVFQTWQTTLAAAATDTVNAGTNLDFHFIVAGRRSK